MSGRRGMKRADMDPDALERQRRRESYREYMKAVGTPVTVPAAPVIAHVRGLNRRGMSYVQICQLAGLHMTTVHKILHRGATPGGKPHMIYRRTAVKLLAVPYVSPHAYPGSRGARMPAHGIQRRLQALVAAGYTYTFLSQALNLGQSAQPAQRLATKDYSWAHYATHELVSGLYDRIQYDKPSEHGITEYGQRRAQNTGSKNGFAPPDCWDDDTIDDPDAVAEWTGKCGKAAGYRIHIRENIPMCEPCREAYSYERSRGRIAVDPDKIRKVREWSGMNRADLARHLGVDQSLVTHWEKGVSRPREPMVDAMCDLWEIPEGSLFMDGEC